MKHEHLAHTPLATDLNGQTACWTHIQTSVFLPTYPDSSLASGWHACFSHNPHVNSGLCVCSESETTTPLLDLRIWAVGRLEQEQKCVGPVWRWPGEDKDLALREGLPQSRKGLRGVWEVRAMGNGPLDAATRVIEKRDCLFCV